MLYKFSEGCLQVNPEQRLSATAILERLAAIAETQGFDIKAPLDIQTVIPATDEFNPNQSNGVKVPPPRPMQPSSELNAQPQVCNLVVIYFCAENICVLSGSAKASSTT